ncbi:hypothetical protein [Nocardia sp. CC227C]|uniref:hypothetical protein n=1 Tax=Nocardia sp. CC227C TaxID=3044562 RepID=UPI00278BB947|nr:hypothetical protein [Nocardia sp. CC227C]
MNPATIRICENGHTGHYPPDLEDLAHERGIDIGFCTQCACGVVAFAIIWGDGLRLMERGDFDLFENFEASGWPEIEFHDPNGTFYCREVPPLGYRQFATARQTKALRMQ